MDGSSPVNIRLRPLSRYQYFRRDWSRGLYRPISTDESARALLAVWVLSLLLFFGRPTLGVILDLLPGNGSLLFQRYISGIQLAGLFLAGVGAVTVVRFLGVAVHRAPTGFSKCWPKIGYFSSSPGRDRRFGWRAGSRMAGTSVLRIEQFLLDARAAIADQTQGAQLNVLLTSSKIRETGECTWDYRTTGATTSESDLYRLQLRHPMADIDSVGLTFRTSSLMTGPEAYFDESNPGDYSTFGVHYSLFPSGHVPPVPAYLVERSGAYVLWSVKSCGIVQVVDTQASISADSSNIGAQTSRFWNPIACEAIYPTIAFDGKAPRHLRWPRDLRPAVRGLGSQPAE